MNQNDIQRARHDDSILITPCCATILPLQKAPHIIPYDIYIINKAPQQFDDGRTPLPKVHSCNTRECKPKGHAIMVNNVTKITPTRENSTPATSPVKTSQTGEVLEIRVTNMGGITIKTV